MAKVTLTTITSGFASVAALNANFATLTAALENTLSRNGLSPNYMVANLDMNSYDILNANFVNCTGLAIAGVDLTAQVALAEGYATDASASAAAALVSETNAAASELAAETAADLIVNWDWQGPWVTATLYYVNNLVEKDGSSYICLVEHTSGTFSTDLSGGKWQLFASIGAAGAGTGDLLSTNNLSDVANAATSLFNIGGQPLDATLTALAGVTTAADKLIYATGADAFATTDFPAFARTLNANTTAADARTDLGAAAEASTQTIYCPAGAMVARTTNGAASGTAETTTNKVMIKTLDFDASTAEYAQFSVRMPKGWDEGTVTAVFSWSHAATATNFDVVWGIQGLAVGNDDALDAAFGTAQTATDTGGTTDDIYISPTTSAVTIAGTPAAEDLVIFQVYRDAAAGGDTLAIDARLHGVTVYYTTTSLNDA